MYIQKKFKQGINPISPELIEELEPPVAKFTSPVLGAINNPFPIKVLGLKI